MDARPQESPQALLAKHGLRPTRQRASVLAALAEEPNDATAQQIHERLRASGERVGLATVYRTLALLGDHGVVDALMHHPGEVCYRLCGADHHHHLVCERCHRVVELAECELDPWLERVAADHGVGPEDVVVFGDMPNDIAAFEWVRDGGGRAVAMAHAHPDLLAVATDVTLGNDEDGVAAFLQSL
jgi:Fe2+ or Zn2+ uptake regulation protein